MIRLTASYITRKMKQNEQRLILIVKMDCKYKNKFNTYLSNLSKVFQQHILNLIDHWIEKNA